MRFVLVDPDEVCPVGTILEHPVTEAVPWCWVLCDGQPLERYPELDALMRPHGHTVVPDMSARGCFIIKFRRAKP